MTANWLNLIEDTPDALKRRVDVAAVAAVLGVDVEDRGGGRYEGLCPFHPDSRPSFAIWWDDEAGHQRAGCWSCDFYGDVFDFVGRREGLASFSAAAKRVAELAADGLPTPQPPPASEPPDWNDLLAYVWSHAAEAAVAALCADRGIGAPAGWLVAEFRLGTDETESAVVIPHLPRAEGDPVAAVKFRRKEPAGGWTTTLTFGGSKLRELYGAWRDRGQRRVVVCEGESDTWSVAWWLREDPETVVLGLPSGAKASPRSEWLDALSGREVVLAFDADPAGRAAARGWADALAPVAASVAVAALPDGADATEAGEAVTRAAIDAAAPLPPVEPPVEVPPVTSMDDRDRLVALLQEAGGLTESELVTRGFAAGLADPAAALGALLATGRVVGPHGGRYYDELTYDRWDANDILPRLSRLTTAAERRSRPPKSWAVDRVIPEYGVGQIFGPSYEGKSFVALDLGLRIANGLPDWHGHAIREAGPVVFVLMEGVFDFQDRIDAWLAAHPGTSDDLLLTLEEEDVDLADPRSLELLETDVLAAAPDAALVVIDTQALATPGTDEDANTAMNLVFANLKRLARRLRCAVATVHHTGHNNQHRARGASGQKGALDFEISVNEGAIRVTKVKAGEPFGPYGFRLEPSGPSVWAAPAAPGVRHRDLNAALIEAGDDGLTVREACEVLGRDYEDESKRKKTTRELQKMAAAKTVKRVPGEKGGGAGGQKPDRYVALPVLENFVEGGS